MIPGIKKKAVADHHKRDRDKSPAVVVFECNDHIGSRVLMSQQRSIATPTFVGRSNSTPHLPAIATNDDVDGDDNDNDDNDNDDDDDDDDDDDGELVSRATVIPRRRKKKPVYPLLVQRKNPALRGRRKRIITKPGYRRSPVIRTEIDDEQSAAAPVSKRQTCVSLFAVAITLCFTAIGLWITQSLTHLIGGSECKCPPMPTCPL